MQNKKQRRFVIGDIHGECEKLKNVLQLADFDYENDQLISLGDLCDRGFDSFGVVEELLKIKNLITVRGNHDEALMDWVDNGYMFHTLAKHGFIETLNSYCRNNPSYKESYDMTLVIPDSHLSFYRGQLPYHIDEQNRLFIHAGYDPNDRIEEQTETTFYWDRTFFKRAWSIGNDTDRLNDVNDFSRVFIGHTPTVQFKKDGVKITTPIYRGQIVNLDTGACFHGGCLSLIDITDDSNHYLWQT